MHNFWSPWWHRGDWSASRAGDPRITPRFPRTGRTKHCKRVLLLWLPCQTPGARYHGGRPPSSDDSFQSNRHSTIGTRQTEYHEALPSSANVQSHLTSPFTDDGNTSWYSVCRMLMVEWRLDCENCRHLTVVGLHDAGPWCHMVRAGQGCLGRCHYDRD